MLGKLLGGKDKFHLELKDEEPVVVTVAPTSATPEVVEPDTEQTEQVVAVASETASAETEASEEKVAPAPAKITQAVSVKEDTSYREEPFWIKLMYRSSEEKAAETAQEKTFATDYLINKPRARRLPGGSVDKFKTMARQTKVRF